MMNAGRLPNLRSVKLALLGALLGRARVTGFEMTRRSRRESQSSRDASPGPGRDS